MLTQPWKSLNVWYNGPGVFLLGVNVKINVAICLEQGGSNNREAAMLKDVITTGKID